MDTDTQLDEPTTEGIEAKVCCYCKAEKDIVHFSRDRTRSDGYKSRCKACMSDTRPKKKKTSVAAAVVSPDEQLRRQARATALKRLVLRHETEFLALVKEEMSRQGSFGSKRWIQP